MAETLIRMPEVMRRVPLSRATIYRKVARKDFPAPRKLGQNSIAWVESEVESWIASRIEGRPE